MLSKQKESFPFSQQIIGSGQREKKACADVAMDDDSGLGNDDEWRISPVPVQSSSATCVTNISDFKRKRPIYPVVKIK